MGYPAFTGEPGAVTDTAPQGWPTWREAMRTALYGERGFYRTTRPGAHFRTSVHASARYGLTLTRLLVHVDEQLGHPVPVDLVDVGAGGGELSTAILRHAPEHLAGRLRVTAVDLAPAPDGLPDAVTWCDRLPAEVVGLVLANEWLDNIPLEVAEGTRCGPRLVHVDPATGTERLGAEPAEEDARWLDRWWPLREPGLRAEVGRPRCLAWAAVIRRLRRGAAIAIDYAHRREARPPYGSLAGYRDGRPVPPIPDGGCDITAHVALDACAEAGREAGATATVLTDQRTALRALGLTGARPPHDLARTDPRGYVAALCGAGEEAELIDADGLGGFGWLVQAAGIEPPACLPLLAPEAPADPVR
ncbi:MAG: hypothetical protein GEV11_07305 [Streptosporangiales bacterium]|nr:hypothetical protein [Streptosporangiales bacterium]